MRLITKVTGGILAAATVFSLAACGDGEAEPDVDNTVVTDVDPMDGEGSIDDTTVIDGTLGSEESMGMENGMPADSNEMMTEEAETAPATNTAAPAEEEEEE